MVQRSAAAAAAAAGEVEKRVTFVLFARLVGTEHLKVLSVGAAVRSESHSAPFCGEILIPSLGRSVSSSLVWFRFVSISRIFRIAAESMQSADPIRSNVALAP